VRLGGGVVFDATLWILCCKKLWQPRLNHQPNKRQVKILVAIHSCGVAANGRQPNTRIGIVFCGWLKCGCMSKILFIVGFLDLNPIELLKVLIFEAILATDSWKTTWVTILSPNQNTVEWIIVDLPA